MQNQLEDAYPVILGKLLKTVMLSTGRDQKQSSCSALYPATSPEIEEKGWNGYYFYFSDPGQLGKERSQASDPGLGAAIWDLRERIVKDKLGEDALVDWTSKA